MPFGQNCTPLFDVAGPDAVKIRQDITEQVGQLLAWKDSGNPESGIPLVSDIYESANRLGMSRPAREFALMDLVEKLVHSKPNTEERLRYRSQVIGLFCGVCPSGFVPPRFPQHSSTGNFEVTIVACRSSFLINKIYTTAVYEIDGVRYSGPISVFPDELPCRATLTITKKDGPLEGSHHFKLHLPMNEFELRKHLERIVEARKCCEFLVECPGLANENLIDPLAILADEYAAKHLPHLSPEELQKAEEALVAEQARAILDQLVASK